MDACRWMPLDHSANPKFSHPLLGFVPGPPVATKQCQSAGLSSLFLSRRHPHTNRLQCSPKNPSSSRQLDTETRVVFICAGPLQSHLSSKNTARTTASPAHISGLLMNLTRSNTGNKPLARAILDWSDFVYIPRLATTARECFCYPSRFAEWLIWLDRGLVIMSSVPAYYR